MSYSITSYEHIVIGESGVPIIAGTNIKVIELVVEKLAYGWSPEEIYFQHPFLTLGQIYSTMAYYWDHEEELNKDIETRLRRVEEIRQRTPQSPLVEKLKPQGLL